MVKHYYAIYAPYGVNTARNAYNPYTVHAFTTPRARDEWVKKDTDENPNPVRRRVTAKQARSYSPPEWYVCHN